ncbi:MAG: SET domain-containing protein [Cyanobacteria bacterium P01_E01_bin.42]
MLCIRGELRPSSIVNDEQGLFTLEFLPKGKIIAIWTCDPGDRIIDEKTYMEEYHNANVEYQHSFVRIIGHYYIGNYDKKTIDDYINHSHSPNLLYHCGILFALQDIEIEEELTVDYRYFFNENDREEFEVDGKPLIGLTAKEALLTSSRKLIEILEDIEDIS